LKQRTLNITESNLALFGSELEKNIKLAAARGEPAWAVAGKEVGKQIWRIEKFNVVPVPVDTYGTFYSGDSYILLNTYKQNDALRWDVHFWLGDHTTQDEAGTAAYKTVELDDFLGGAPIQHREVMGNESALFLSYFEHNPIRILQGGVDSGFNHVTPEEYKPRLLHIQGNRFPQVSVNEVFLHVSSLNSGDVFILDNGKKVYQWNGKKSSPHEKGKAGQFCQAIDHERKGLAEITVHSEGDSDLDDFFKILGGTAADVKEKVENVFVARTKSLFRLSDATGKLEFTKVCEGKVQRNQLQSSDVFIFDAGMDVYAWVGKNTSPNEKKSAITYANQYIINNDLPPWTSISRVLEASESAEFHTFFD